MRLKRVAPLALLVLLCGTFVRSAPQQSRRGVDVAPQKGYAPVAEALSKFIQNEMQEKKLPAF
ncbi:MAG: hypothetical protein WA644_08040, partial [Candidatus Acidiferrales bacterium]